MARNRKRAKERRARRPQAQLINGRGERDESAPNPIGHASPDVELAEAQLALGRPELSGETEPDDDEFEDELEREAVDGGDVGGEPPSGRDLGGGGAAGGGGVSAGGGGEVARRRQPPGARLVGFLQGSWRELQRVQWPDRRQVVQATGVVIGFVIVAGVFLGVSDFLAGKLVNFILK